MQKLTTPRTHEVRRAGEPPKSAPYIALPRLRRLVDSVRVSFGSHGVFLCSAGARARIDPMLACLRIHHLHNLFSRRRCACPAGLIGTANWLHVLQLNSDNRHGRYGTSWFPLELGVVMLVCFKFQTNGRQPFSTRRHIIDSQSDRSRKMRWQDRYGGQCVDCGRAATRAC
jgi:hypothetical protein